MVTAAKGAEIYYNYTGEDAPEPSSEGGEGDNDGLRVRKESPAIVPPPLRRPWTWTTRSRSATRTTRTAT